MLIYQPAFLPIYHVTLIRKHTAIWEKTTMETTLNSYIKKNFKYIPQPESFQRTLDAT